MLSAASSWTNEDGDFVLSIFYDRIINLFRDDEGGEWTQQTLVWWNRYATSWPSTVYHLILCMV